MGVTGSGLGQPSVVCNGLVSGAKPWDWRMSDLDRFCGFRSPGIRRVARSNNVRAMLSGDTL